MWVLFGYGGDIIAPNAGPLVSWPYSHIGFGEREEKMMIAKCLRISCALRYNCQSMDLVL